MTKLFASVVVCGAVVYRQAIVSRDGIPCIASAVRASRPIVKAVLGTTAVVQFAIVDNCRRC